MRVVVTGLSGFIGSRLAPRLPADWEIVSLVRQPGQAPHGITELPADLSEADWVGRLPDRIDAVVHVAQSRHYRQFPSHGLCVFDENVRSTALLLDYAARAGANRFCLFSSGSVYENYTHAGPFCETRIGRPTSLNGASKLAAEAHANCYSDQFNLSVLRVFFPYGPGQTDRIVPQLAKHIQDGDAVSLAGETGITLAPLFADDLVDVAIAAIQDGWRGVVNVAGPELLSVRQMSDIVGERLGLPVSYKVTDDEPIRYEPRLDSLDTLYGCDRLTRFADGIAKTVSIS